MTIVDFILPIFCVILGFILNIGYNHGKKYRQIKKNYSILIAEMKHLKEDSPDGLDSVIHRYHQLVGARSGTNTEIVPADQNPSDFLKRWSFRNKYPFLLANLDKLSELNPEIIKSLLKIFSYLEEFENYKQLSISEPDNLRRIGMGDPELLLISDLEKAKSEISNVLRLMESE